MISRVFFLLLIAVLLPQLAAAKSQNQLFQEANAAYSKNDFITAISIYESLISEHGYSPGVLYNLANSYAQAGYPGQAILNYERALRLEPGNSDIIANLEKVQSEHGLFTKQKSLTAQLAHSLSMNQWGLLTLAALSAIALTILASVYWKVPRRTVTSISISSAVALLLSVSCMIMLRQNWHSSIITTTSPLLISPFDGAATIGTAQEGRRVFPQKYHGGYVYIVSETGRTGWLPATDLEPVVPKPR